LVCGALTVFEGLAEWGGGGESLTCGVAFAYLPDLSLPARL